MVAAAGGGVCGAVPGLDGRRPCCAGRPADGWKWSFPVAVHRQVVDVLGGVLAAEEGMAAGAFSPGVGVSAQALAHVN